MRYNNSEECNREEEIDTFLEHLRKNRHYFPINEIRNDIKARYGNDYWSIKFMGISPSDEIVKHLEKANNGEIVSISSRDAKQFTLLLGASGKTIRNRPFIFAHVNNVIYQYRFCQKSYIEMGYIAELTGIYYLDTNKMNKLNILGSVLSHNIILNSIKENNIHNLLIIEDFPI